VEPVLPMCNFFAAGKEFLHRGNAEAAEKANGDSDSWYVRIGTICSRCSARAACGHRLCAGAGGKRACSGGAISEDPLGALSPGTRAKTEEREALARPGQREHILPDPRRSASISSALSAAQRLDFLAAAMPRYDKSRGRRNARCDARRPDGGESPRPQV